MADAMEQLWLWLQAQWRQVSDGVIALWNAQTPGTQDQIRGTLYASAVLTVIAALWRQFQSIGRHLRAYINSGATSTLSTHAAPKPPHREVPSYRFVERDDENNHDLVQRTIDQLSTGGVVTLWGAGGTGKTTLALEVAHRTFKRKYHGGVIWSSANDRLDYGVVELLDTVLVKLAYHDTEIIPIARRPREELAQECLSDAMPCLLALDNFDTIAPKEQQPILRFLTELPCPVLVTSRDLLPIGTNIRVGPMKPREADLFLVSLIEHSDYHTRLAMVDRSEISRIAASNPMLMRWVVRQLEEATDAHDVFDDIEQGKGEAVERIFERSFHILEPDAQVVLLALALFAKNVNREPVALVAFGQSLGSVRDRLNAAIRRLARQDLLESDANHIGLTTMVRKLAQGQLLKDQRVPEMRSRFEMLPYDNSVFVIDFGDPFVTTPSSGLQP